MKKKELQDLLNQLGFHPGKILGQNFLVDGNMLDYIVRAADPQPNEWILEAGPGFGVLTRELLDAGANVISIEFDHRICDYLRTNLTNPHFTLVEGDACQVELEPLIGDREFRAIANLPYSISSIFVARLTELARPPRSMCFMLQKEMAQRLAADPQTPNYGALSVNVQLVYDVKLLRMVPPQVFYPQPDVESAVVEFRRRDQFPEPDQRRRIVKLSRLAFSQKRKKMVNPLSGSYPKEKILAAFAKLGIRDDCRPGQLTPAQFVALTDELCQP